MEITEHLQKSPCGLDDNKVELKGGDAQALVKQEVSKSKEQKSSSKSIWANTKNCK
jgi:hypothetical protein